MVTDRRPRRRRVAALVLAAGGALALPAHALYKVVGPDGKVTYTDRPPSGAQSRITPITPAGGPAAAASGQALPAELREPAGRYPVTLYVIPDCAPCDAARTLLRDRGVPYAEKLASTPEDVEALQRIAGTREAPTLTIGAQPLRGLSPEAWNAYLDSAGYPRESRLPAGWRWPAATPVVESRQTAGPAAASRPGSGTNARTRDDEPVRPAQPASGGLRF